MPAKFNTKSLDLDEKFLDVDNFVPDQRLQEDTDQSDQSVLHVPDRGVSAQIQILGITYLSLIVSQVEMQFEM